MRANASESPLTDKTMAQCRSPRRRGPHRRRSAPRAPPSFSSADTSPSTRASSSAEGGYRLRRRARDRKLLGRAARAARRLELVRERKSQLSGKRWCAIDRQSPPRFAAAAPFVPSAAISSSAVTRSTAAFARPRPSPPAAIRRPPCSSASALVLRVVRSVSACATTSRSRLVRVRGDLPTKPRAAREMSRVIRTSGS